MVLRDRVRGNESNADLSTRRLEAFTDGVFSIAATILVLDLTVDEIGKVESNTDLVQHLLHTLPQLMSFVISFLLIGLLWLVHVRQFEQVVRIDNVTVWLNTARLLTVVLIPFTTSIVSDYSDFILGRMMLPINFFAAILVASIQWWYLVSPRRNLVTNMDEPQRRSTRIGSGSALLLAGIVVALSPWLGSVAFAIYIAEPIADRMLDRVTRRKVRSESRS
jgi:uncharacterized membrane protein